MRERFYVPSQLHRHLMATTRPEFAWNGGPFEAWKEQLLERFRPLVGEMPAEGGPLNVEELERQDMGAYVRTKIVFTAEPRADVPGYLLVPKDLDGPAPAMVCIQGHSPGAHLSVGIVRDEQDRESLAGDRDFALQAVRHGWCALAIEQRCFGERSETLQAQRSSHGCFDAVMHSLMLGRTMIGERVWDVMRGIELLQSVPEVDDARIACMGNSGGGTVTFYAQILDPRIQLGVVSCAFCTYADAIMSIYHCADNYLPGVLKVAEMGDLAGLIAPRKLLVVAGREDPIFPIDGVRRAYEQARAIFEAAGCPQNIEMLVGEDGHRFYAEMAWPLINRMLRGD